jgi:two-component system, sporulation sensor kinase E
MKPGFLDKLIGRLDRVQPGEVQSYLIRLVQEKGFLEKVFQALQEGVLVLDPDGKISFLNRAASRLFGLHQEDDVGARLSARVRGLDWQALSSSRRSISRDLEVFYPEHRFLNFYLAPLDPSATEPLGFVMLIRDITQTRKIAEEQIESERVNLLTMLAAGVAHELGNPLNSLTIHLQLLARQLRRSHPDALAAVEEQLEVASAEVRRLDSIIQQFLVAMRPSQPRPELVLINELVDESLRVLGPELADRQIILDLQLEPGLPLLSLDPGQMKQAFFNLIRNAAQAMPPGGILHIATESDDAAVRITFQDDGQGMSPETLSQLFQPYFTTKTQGTGLGLLIVRRIVREHGGEVEVQSEEGVGTAFTLHLPRDERRVRLLPQEADFQETTAVDIPPAP